MPDRSRRASQALLVLRLLVAGLIAAHGWARWMAGGVPPFGEWLGSLGLPAGFWIAAAITAFEILGTPLLAIGRWVSALALTYCAIYAVGIALVHWPAGWLVVGLGRNGMEYSVLLIACLAAHAWVHWPERRRR